MVDAEPTVYPRYLADALTVLANALRQAGRLGKAVIAATDALTLYDQHPEYGDNNRGVVEEIIRTYTA